MTKTCCTCKQHKGDGEFHRSKVNKDGLFYQCKKCKQEYQQRNWASVIVHRSRYNDHKHHRPTDDDDYIDPQWVADLVRDDPTCHYCKAQLDFGIGVNRCLHPAGLQLDRMDSRVPHLKANCVQCCQTCNKRCQTMPYLWKVLSGGGNFAHFDMKWCPSRLHNGGDEGNHVLSIDEFDPSESTNDGLSVYCKACTRPLDTARKQKYRAMKKLRTS